MDAKRLHLKHIAVITVALLLLGTVLSFFIAPRIYDAQTRRKLGLPDDAYVTDTARSPWIYVTEKGSGRLYGDKMIGIKRLYIPSAVNGIHLERVLLTYDEPRSVEAVILPATLNYAKTYEAFQNWEGLKTIIFAEGTEDLSGSTLSSMPALEEVYLPASLKKISKKFLKEEDVTVYYAGTEEEWLALGDGARELLTEHAVVLETPLPDWAEK